MHRAVDTVGHLWAAPVTATNVQDRSQVSALAAQVHYVTGDTVEIASVDQGYTGAQAAQDAAVHHRDVVVVTRSEAQKGFVLLPKRWVVERSVAWAGRFRRLTRDDEQLADTLASLHFVAFALLMLNRFVELLI